MKITPCIQALLGFVLHLNVQAADPLVGYVADPDQTSVSGISSGGYMATQFHVAYSGSVIGAGNVAGGPYYCGASNPYEPNVITALSRCMDPCDNVFSFFRWSCEVTWQPYSVVKGEEMIPHAAALAELGLIDPLSNLADDRVYLFSGKYDITVVPAVVAANRDFYAGLGLSGDALKHVEHPDAAHAFITPMITERRCGAFTAPYLNKCKDYHQAWEILNQIYGGNDKLNPPVTQLSGEIVEFDQAAFVPPERLNSSALAATAYAYIPAVCETESCRIHVAFHGCHQAAVEHQGKFPLFRSITGYNEAADSNRIIVLYPQLRSTDTMDNPYKVPYNPKGCWDFWGYSGDDFYTQEGIQMKAVRDMILRLSEPKPN